MIKQTAFRVYSRLLTGAMLGVLMLAGPNTAAAQPDGDTRLKLQIAAQTEQGKQALAARDYDTALAAFQEGLSLTAQLGNQEIGLAASLYFNLGLTHQQRQSAEDDLDQAEAYYQRVLVLQESGAAHNNLAHLYIQAERFDDAAETFALAIDAKDGRQAFYATNLANLYRQQGQLAAAIRYYTLALEMQPDNTQLHEALVDAYLAQDGEDRAGLIGYLWTLLGHGKEVRALETALTTLRTTSLSQEDKLDLLTCAVAALSKQTYEPGTFEKTQAFASFIELAETDTDIGPGAAEVVFLHKASAILSLVDDEEAVDRSRWPRWWAERALPDDEPPPGRVWPLDAFRMLVRGLGSWYQQHEEKEIAEAYYLFSLNLKDQESPDPDALLHLAELRFGEENAYNRIHALLDRYAGPLFEGKAVAIHREQWKKTYEYHRTLGVMLGLVGAWGDSGTPFSAVFQLEQARTDVERYNATISDPEQTPPLRFEPRLVNMLADGYEQTDRERDAADIRLWAAEKYADEGDQRSVDAVLKPLDDKPLPNDLRRQYDRLRVQTERIAVIGRVIDAQQGNPIPEATLIIRGVKTATTNDDGAFRLRARLGDTLQVTKIGYQGNEAVILGDALTITLSRTRLQDTRLQDARLQDTRLDSNLLTITGTVTTAQGRRPLTGVVITVRGRTTTTRTQPDGTYSLRARPGDVLVFSHERFPPKRMTVGTRTVVNVTL